jgi:hypothetical protein
MNLLIEFIHMGIEELPNPITLLLDYPRDFVVNLHFELARVVLLDDLMLRESDVGDGFGHAVLRHYLVGDHLGFFQVLLGAVCDVF